MHGGAVAHTRRRPSTRPTPLVLSVAALEYAWLRTNQRHRLHHICTTSGGEMGSTKVESGHVEMPADLR